MSVGTRPLALVISVALLALSVGIGAGCGGDDDGDGGGSSGSGEIKMASPLIGPKNDKSFAQAAYEGMQQAVKEQDNLKLTATLENRETDQERTDAVETLAPINDLVVGVSASFGPVFDALAPKFPDTYFLDIAGATSQFHDNATGLANEWGAPAYVIGVVTAHMTKSKVVGYVGGAEIPPTVHAQNGFVAGVKSVDPSIKVLTNITGDFNDVAKGKAATESMIADGTDVIFPFLDAGIEGAFAAGRESGKMPPMFKITIADCDAYPAMVGTEIVDNKTMTAELIDRFVKGTLEPGNIYLDLQSPDLQTFELCPKYADDKKLADATKETIEKMNAGEIELPEDARYPRPDFPYKEGLDGDTQNTEGYEDKLEGGSQAYLP
jgi:basic membrane protein A and related proteins